MYYWTIWSFICVMRWWGDEVMRLHIYTRGMRKKNIGRRFFWLSEITKIIKIIVYYQKLQGLCFGRQWRQHSAAINSLPRLEIFLSTTITTIFSTIFRSNRVRLPRKFLSPVGRTLASRTSILSLLKHSLGARRRRGSGGHSRPWLWMASSFAYGLVQAQT